MRQLAERFLCGTTTSYPFPLRVVGGVRALRCTAPFLFLGPLRCTILRQLGRRFVVQIYARLIEPALPVLLEPRTQVFELFWVLLLALEQVVFALLALVLFLLPAPFRPLLGVFLRLLLVPPRNFRVTQSLDPVSNS